MQIHEAHLTPIEIVISRQTIKQGHVVNRLNFQSARHRTSCDDKNEP